MELEREGQRVPELDEKPSIFGLEWVWEAYIWLSTCRGIGAGGLGPIPWTAIEEYKDRYEIDDEDASLLEYSISALEKAFFNRLDKDRQAVGKAKKRALRKAGGSTGRNKNDTLGSR